MFNILFGVNCSRFLLQTNSSKSVADIYVPSAAY